MPKRTIALYDDSKKSSDEDTDNDDLDLNDYLTDPNCSDIIKNQHYFDFEENMGHKLTRIYRKHAYLCSNESYINDKKMLHDDQFLMFIYQHIFKNYDNDFIKDNEMLKNIFYNNLPCGEIVKSKESKKIIVNSNSKKFDWATKSYK